MDTILVEKNWIFLEESTDEELNLLISVVSQCCKIDIDKLNRANIISQILQLRDQEEKSSFKTFLNDIGEEVGCDPKITWVLYPYMLLVSLLRDSLINCTSEMTYLKRIRFAQHFCFQHLNRQTPVCKYNNLIEIIIFSI
jgi:hypothetical protein